MSKLTDRLAEAIPKGQQRKRRQQIARLICKSCPVKPDVCFSSRYPSQNCHTLMILEALSDLELGKVFGEALKNSDEDYRRDDIEQGEPCPYCGGTEWKKK